MENEETTTKIPDTAAKKTTINLGPTYVQMLQEIEDRWGVNQTSTINLGIVLAHRFYFTDSE